MRGASQSTVALAGPLAVTAHDVPGADLARAVGGTPVDAVAFGILTLGGADGFDLVVSGINAGANVGIVAHYSGTVGAARVRRPESGAAGTDAGAYLAGSVTITPLRTDWTDERELRRLARWAPALGAAC